MNIAERLVSIRDRQELRDTINHLFGNISEERFQELWDGDDYANRREEYWFPLAVDYQADLETAAVEHDIDEVMRILRAVGIRVVRSKKPVMRRVMERPPAWLPALSRINPGVTYFWVRR